jgi:hypothetical protein
MQLHMRAMTRLFQKHPMMASVYTQILADEARDEQEWQDEQRQMRTCPSEFAAWTEAHIEYHERELAQLRGA